MVNKKINFIPNNITSDPNGRYVFVSGLLFQQPVLLVNVYAPNWDDVTFIKKLLSSLTNLDTHKLIFGGDLYTVINPTLDRSSSKHTAISKMARSLSYFMEDNGCIDPWRFLNPSLKSFSFFSHAHQTYSRIDYFFIDKSFLNHVSSVDYLPIVISDHAPVQMDVHFTFHPKSRPQWRLCPLLLADTGFCEKISSSIDFFIATNKTESTSDSLLWETLKAFLRGEIISFTSYKNKKTQEKLQTLTDSIKKIDLQLALNPCPELCKKRLNLHSKLNLLSTRNAEELLLKTRGLVYEYDDKCSRLLSHQLK